MKKLNYILSTIALSFSVGTSFAQIGQPWIHDPSTLAECEGKWYTFGTGGGGLISDDGWSWHGGAERPGGGAAPDAIKIGDRYLVIYGATGGGLGGGHNGRILTMWNKTLDPKSPDFGWEDKGMVIASHRRVDNWNAIDPNLIVDKKGQPYLTYGSFWDGIQLIKLNKKDFQTPVTKPVTIARRIGKKLSLAETNNEANFTVEGGNTIEAGDNAIEAPFIFYHNGYYYLFVSFDYCCRGQNSTYKTVYGRSKKIEGPYLDKSGKKMEYGGGTRLYGPDEDYFGVGHSSAYEWDGKCYFISHAYEKDKNGAAKLFIRPMEFDKDGWIVEEE